MSEKVLSSQKYKAQRYWDERYTTEESYDWFCDLQTVDSSTFKMAETNGQDSSVGMN